MGVKSGKQGVDPIEVDLETVERYASQGMTYEQISDSLGISSATLLRRRQNSAALEEAIKRGKAKGIEVVTNQLFKQVGEGNTTATIFFLKCRAGWVETNQLNLANNKGESLIPPKLNIHFVTGDGEDSSD